MLYAMNSILDLSSSILPIVTSSLLDRRRSMFGILSFMDSILESSIFLLAISA